MLWSIIALILLVQNAQSVCWSQTGFDCTGTCDSPTLLCAGAISPGCECYDPGLYALPMTPAKISWKHGLLGKILHDKAKVLLKDSIFQDILQQIPLDLSLLERGHMLESINQALADVLKEDAGIPSMCQAAGCCWNNDLGCFGCDGWECTIEA